MYSRIHQNLIKRRMIRGNLRKASMQIESISVTMNITFSDVNMKNNDPNNISVAVHTHV